MVQATEVKNQSIFSNQLHCFSSFKNQNDTIHPDDWTFEKFYQLYHKICPRSDIEELFHSMLVICKNPTGLITFSQLI